MLKITQIALFSMASKAAIPSNNGLMMILSPAKTLNLDALDQESLAVETTRPSCDSEKTNALAKILKEKSKKDLKSLLKISDNLATSVSEYYQRFETDSSKRSQIEQIPASFAFDGPAYKGLDAKTCRPKSLLYLQQNLRIIDPLYGCLRPLDLIQPYRLEMNSSKILDDLTETPEKHKKLASWWSTSITESISIELTEKTNGKHLINLASDEYSAAINTDLLPDGTKYIKVVFQQEGKVIAVHAKRARGLMVRFISDNQITELDDLKKFEEDGYSFHTGRSSDDTFVFDRPKPDAKQKRKADPSSKEKNARRRR